MVDGKQVPAPQEGASSGRLVRRSESRGVGYQPDHHSSRRSRAPNYLAAGRRSSSERSSKPSASRTSRASKKEERERRCLGASPTRRDLGALGAHVSSNAPGKVRLCELWGRRSRAFSVRARLAPILFVT